MMAIRIQVMGTAALGIAALLFAAALGAAVSPQLRDKERRHAQYRLSVMVETVIPTARGGMGRLDTCSVRARVTRLIHVRKGTFSLARQRPAESPRPGALIHTKVSCWAYDNRVFEPLAGHRIYYGGPERYIHLEMWGSFIDGRFVLFDFVNRDRV